MNAESKRFEVVFASCDRTEGEFKRMFPDDCPWLAIPFGASECRAVGNAYGNGYIPCLTIVTGSGKIIEKGARPKDGDLEKWERMVDSMADE